MYEYGKFKGGNKLMKKHSKKLIALLLSVLLLVAMFPFSTFAAEEDKTIELSVISDTHYYPEEYMGPQDNEAWLAHCIASGKHYSEVPGLLESALESVKQRNDAKKANGEKGLEYILLPGDLTRDGELEGHKALAARLEQFQIDTGIKVFVIPGNHDINNQNAQDYASGPAKKVASATPEDFKNIYKNLGYDASLYEDYRAFMPASGKKAGMLSYSLKLADGYRLIAMDSCKYSSDSTKSGENVQETGGSFSAELMQWILDECAKAKANGETIVGMVHHSIVAHHKYQALVLQDFPIDQWELVSEQLADTGMHFVFTGHSHANDISYGVSDIGEGIYDIQTSALSSFPNDYRQVKFTTDTKGKVIFDVESIEADEVKKIESVYGEVFDQPYIKRSFNFSYANGDAAKTISGMINSYVKGFLNDIAANGGLNAFLKQQNVDVMDLIGGLVGGFGEIKDGKLNIMGSDIDIQGTINSLFSQVENRYIKDTDKTISIIDGVIKKLANIPLSDVPFTQLLEEYGIGNAAKGGTFGDVIIACAYNSFYGDENIYRPSDPDAFLQDVIKNLESGKSAQLIFNTLIDVLFSDIVDELLPNITLSIKTVFPNGGTVANLVKGLLGKETATLQEVLKIVLDMGLLGQATSLKDLLQKEYLDKYMTESQTKALGYLFSDAIQSFSVDTDPQDKGDRNATYVYDGPVEIKPTAENYQIPSNIAVTYGKDTATSRNFNWYTKSTVTGTDIQIIPYAENPNFENTAEVSYQQTNSSTQVQESYPGLDLMIIQLFDYTKYLTRHQIEVTGLKANEKYSYRIGDAELGWWSEAGVIKTADNSDEVAFLHLTDPQSQNPDQFAAWGNTIDVAKNTVPDAKFILGTGDFVDSGSNAAQWQWMFNASDNLRSLPMMPATGNHELSGDNAIDKNFNITNAPQQDRTSGIYYSFDYNNVHIMVLNTNDMTDDGLSAQQLEWLKKDAAESKAQWKVVAMHKALYSNGSHYKDNDIIALREQLGTLMPELGIDLVLQGHDHVYLRTDSLKGNQIVDYAADSIKFSDYTYATKVNQEGSVYVISGCAGVKTYQQIDAALTDEYFPRAEVTKAIDAPTFSAVRIVGDTLYFDAYTISNGDTAERIDSFALSKQAVKPTPKPTPAPQADAPVVPSPSTGDNGIAIILPMSLLASAAFVISRKRKRK